MGALNLSLYGIGRFMIQNKFIRRLIISTVFCVYMLQFIAQMHGMYEMHFFFFINIAILIIYQDWRIMVPYTLLAVVHHTFFFILQLQGMENVGQYFIADESITWETLYWHFGLVALMGVVCGWWAIILRKMSESRFEDKEQLEQQLTGMQQNINFALDLTRGNFQTEHQIDPTDDLGRSLLEMRSYLLEASQRDKQEKFLNQGLALINETLRTSNGDMNKLSVQLVTQLVKYMQANQGGLFILQGEAEQDPHLQLLACYAYDRRKFLEKRVELGEGLLGQAVLEKDTVYLTEVPENYVQITSGLGAANPRSVLIVPLQDRGQVVGVLELVSFRKFERYHIEFLEKVGESIATSIISAKTAAHTKRLLEQGEAMAQQMHSQEEEMRQHMEELVATQEAVQRQLAQDQLLVQEFEARQKVFNLTTIMSEGDLHGTILEVNDKLCEVSKFKRAELIGKSHNLFRHPDMPKQVFKLMWQAIKQGKTFRGIIKNRAKDGSHYWVDAVISPVLDEAGKPIKYIGIRYVIPDDSLAETLYQQMLLRMESALIQT
jgi:methyl-accepting chemotaxis protein